MFKSNNQPGLFGFETELSKKQRDLLEQSKEKWFYNLFRLDSSMVKLKNGNIMTNWNEKPY